MQRATVLVVEDDAATREVLQQMLAMEGYDTVLAASGAEALQALQQHQVDLMLLDIMLPDMSGYHLCAQVRGSHSMPAPIMMVSALGQPHDITRGLHTGADDYLRKPFASEELLARMQKLLDRHEHVLITTQENARLQDRLRRVHDEVATLQQASATEALLRREFLHNVATHMQALCGILDAETRKLPPSPERDTVQRIRARVYGAALVYQTSEELANDPVPIGKLIARSPRRSKACTGLGSASSLMSQAAMCSCRAPSPHHSLCW
jgi:DNA-binding response OmpR family regulator